MKRLIAILTILLIPSAAYAVMYPGAGPGRLTMNRVYRAGSTVTVNDADVIWNLGVGGATLDFRIQSNSTDILTVTDLGLVGLVTSAPDKVLEINSATGANLRLTYNDNDGSATNYADFSTTSGGDLTIAASGGDVSFSDDNVTTTGTIGVRHSFTLATPYQQVVTVAKSGGDFTTIQAAIDSIADATTTKRYVVKVQSGVYTEAVTLKDYVDVIGAGRTNTIIAGSSGTVLTFPATKCTVSEVGINVDYGTIGAASAAITSAGADSVLKDCDITVTKSGGDFVMNGLTITAGSFRMSDCYFTYSDTGATTATQRVQSAVVQSGVLTTVLLNNNEMTISTTDTNDDLVGFETTANVTGTALVSNCIIAIDAGAAASSATGLWVYGTATGFVFNQNRLTVNCNASAYGLSVDSTAGGATVDSRHNEIIITAVGAAEGGDIATGDTWNSTFDQISASTPYTGAGTINLASSGTAGAFTTTGNITIDSDSSLLRLGDVQTDYTIGWDGSDAVHTITAGDFVFTGGNVGVGTTSPQVLMELAATGGNAKLNLKRTDSVLAAGDLQWIGSDNLIDARISYHNITGSALSFMTGAGGASARMTILDGGYVGINTVSPNVPLEVNGNIRLTADSQQLQFGTAQDAYLTFDGDSLNIVANAVGATNTLEMTAGDFVFTGGNVGIGITPTSRLHVVESALVTTAGYELVDFEFAKTGGVTDPSDNFVGVSTQTELNHSGGTIGELWAMDNLVLLTAGTVGERAPTGTDDVLAARNVARIAGGTAGDDVYGLFNLVDGNSGTIDGATFGMRTEVDLESALTQTGAVYGNYIWLDDDSNTGAGSASTVYMLYLRENSNVDYGIYQQGTADNYFGGSVTVNAGDVVASQGAVATTPDATTLGVGAATLAVDTCVVTLTGDGGGNTIGTITGGVSGQLLTIIFVDANVTITDTDAHTANTVDLAGTATNLTSADDTVLQLVFDGVSWYEVSRSVN